MIFYNYEDLEQHVVRNYSNDDKIKLIEKLYNSMEGSELEATVKIAKIIGVME